MGEALITRRGGGGGQNIEYFSIWSSKYGEGVFTSEFPTTKSGQVLVYGSGVNSSDYRYKYGVLSYYGSKPTSNLEVVYDGTTISVPAIKSNKVSNLSLCFVKILD